MNIWVLNTYTIYYLFLLLCLVRLRQYMLINMCIWGLAACACSCWQLSTIWPFVLFPIVPICMMGNTLLNSLNDNFSTLADECQTHAPKKKKKTNQQNIMRTAHSQTIQQRRLKRMISSFSKEFPPETDCFRSQTWCNFAIIINGWKKFGTVKTSNSPKTGGDVFAVKHHKSTGISRAWIEIIRGIAMAEL